MRLGQIYRAELLIEKALVDFSHYIREARDKETWTRSLDMHRTNQEGLRELFSALSYSPTDDIEIPHRLARLLKRGSVPNRLLFSWLNQCETELQNLYKQVDKNSLPMGDRELFTFILRNQHATSDEIAMVSQLTTYVLDPAAWEA